MKTLKLLFTGIGRRVELIQAFRQAANHLNIHLKIYGADMLETAPALIYCDAVQKVCSMKDGFKGDTALIYKTCILKKYPFKIVENEKFIGENYVYDQIDEKYKMFLMNKIIYICSYLPDGYTKNTINLLKKNPYSYMVMKKQSSRISRKMRYKIKHMAGYIAMGLLKKEKKLIRKSGNPIIAIISYPVGILIYFVRFRE